VFPGLVFLQEREAGKDLYSDSGLAPPGRATLDRRAVPSTPYKNGLADKPAVVETLRSRRRRLTLASAQRLSAERARRSSVFRTNVFRPRVLEP